MGGPAPVVSPKHVGSPRVALKMARWEMQPFDKTNKHSSPISHDKSQHGMNRQKSFKVLLLQIISGWEWRWNELAQNIFKVFLYCRFVYSFIFKILIFCRKSKIQNFFVVWVHGRSTPMKLDRFFIDWLTGLIMILLQRSTKERIRNHWLWQFQQKKPGRQAGPLTSGRTARTETQAAEIEEPVPPRFGGEKS